MPKPGVIVLRLVLVVPGVSLGMHGVGVITGRTMSSTTFRSVDGL